MTAADAVVWLAVALGGVGTFCIRASFLFLYERLDIPKLDAVHRQRRPHVEAA